MHSAAFARVLADNVRTDAYEAAIRATVRPGDVVLDIGCGIGILSLLACRAGARKVYALETSDAIATAMEIAAANRIDRIEFIHGTSTDVTLPEPADVIVSDVRSVLPVLQQHLPSIVDGRRHLTPGGVLIPERNELYVGLVDAPDAYERIDGPWRRHDRGFYLEPARRLTTNAWDHAHMDRDQLLGQPQHWATVDYRTVNSPHVHNTVTLKAARAGVAHGLIVWFDAILCEGIGYSNAPGSDETIYGAFFPFAEALDVAPEDRLIVDLSAHLAGADYTWSWTSALYRAKVDEPSVTMHQSTIFGRPISVDSIRKRATDFVPDLTADGEVDAVILRAMTEHFSVGEIADDLLLQFSHRFPSRGDALARVGDFAERYSR